MLIALCLWKKYSLVLFAQLLITISTDGSSAEINALIGQSKKWITVYLVDSKGMDLNLEVFQVYLGSQYTVCLAESIPEIVENKNIGALWNLRLDISAGFTSL